MTLATDLAPGFDEPVHRAQQVFRTVLRAFSRPGTVLPLEGVSSPPEPLSGTLAAIALTLLDHETPVYLSPPLNSENALRYIAFHTGAPIVGKPEDGHFILGMAGRTLPDVMSLKAGTAEYPDRSATLLLDVGGFSSGETVSLSGPGIVDDVPLTVDGLDSEFWVLARRNHTRLPLGVDFLFCGPDAVAGLPRSTRIKV